MADSTPAPETTTAAEPSIVSHKPQSDTRPAQPDPSSAATPPLPNPNPSAPQPPSGLIPPPPPIQPSFRPAGPPVPVPSAAATPQFSHLTFQTPGALPPGVAMALAPTVGSGPPPQVQMASLHPVISPYAVAGQPMRFVPPMPNGYQPMPQPAPQGAMPPGVRYPSFAPMIRPGFPPRPLFGVMPQLARPPIIGIRGPLIPPVVRPPVIPSATPAEEPQTTVYVGKISSTVDNDFMLSLLKSWKRPQDPTGTLKGFGFCEFESAEGVLRALRLLSNLSLDGQELKLNVNPTARKLLERYVEKKTGSSKKESETEGAEKKEASALVPDSNEKVKPSEESVQPSSDEQKKDGNETNKENPDTANFGLVTDEDRNADHEALEKLTGMLEERLKNNPLPPPPPPPIRAVDGPGNSHSEQLSGSRDKESDEDVPKNDAEDKTEDDKTAESKPSSELERTDTGSPDRSRRHDKSRDRDRELRREKERELERYERDREQERSKREKEREYRSREDERRYKVREKEWEVKERDREHWRKREREREKQRAQERKWEIADQERDDDDGYGKKRKHKTGDEERKRRQREKEEDLADRLREEEEIAEAEIRAQEEQQKKQLEVLKTDQPANGHEKSLSPNENSNEHEADQTVDHKLNRDTYEGEDVLQNGASGDFVTSSNTTMDVQQNSNLPTRKLGFGLSGSGKRAAVPSVFNEDEDEDARKEKKMRPLVPIDYSTEEVTQPSISESPSANMVAAAEFAKRIPTANSKEDKADVEKERSRRHHERSSHRDRDRHEGETNSTREESRKDHLERERSHKTKTPENQKLLDAKQLIDTIPKTKDELFSYDINWATYDQNALHERMRPWISKKITEYLGEEEVTLVDYIVSSTQEHVEASEMLERLQTILDDEAEMFVLKMWRMLIFEVKKVETGLAPKSRA
ncbi:RNA-binding protein 25 [Phtheirospermum japonicum]|uniref:RNA-binding protein 25 n=1 Tax=Phtheirospermum japonicum TaxID=374723 RepID=A0A830D197_9LAMI|nr:RNA-binding protein 25 [Phtheirospermum japonicum]